MSQPHLNATLRENDNTGELSVRYQVTGTFTAPLWGAGVGEPEAVHDAVKSAAWAAAACRHFTYALEAASRLPGMVSEEMKEAIREMQIAGESKARALVEEARNAAK